MWFLKLRPAKSLSFRNGHWSEHHGVQINQKCLQAVGEVLIISGEVTFGVEGQVKHSKHGLVLRRGITIRFDEPFRMPPSVTANLLIEGRLKPSIVPFELTVEQVRRTSADISVAVPIDDLHKQVMISWLAVGNRFDQIEYLKANGSGQGCDAST